jgi:hypothetical protein
MGAFSFVQMLILFSWTVTALVDTTWKNSLCKLYDEMGGDNWVLPAGESSWHVKDQKKKACDFTRTSADYCTYFGIRCSADNIISALTLFQLGVSGSLPDTADFWEGLKTLNVISMSFNNITGTLPGNLSRMENITGIHLHHNKLTGSLPAAMGKLKKLKVR